MRKAMIKFRLLKICVYSLLPIIFTGGCIPIYSELQTARTVGQGNIEISPTYTTGKMFKTGDYKKTLDQSTDYVDDDYKYTEGQIGFYTAIGLTDNIDLRARYIRAWSKEDYFEGGNIISIGLKYGVIKDKLAFYLPIGGGIDDGNIVYLQAHPTALITFPLVENKIDLTLSPKYLITLEKGYYDYFATNIGLSISSNLNKWAIRPEYGIAYAPKTEQFFGQFSICISTKFGKLK